MISLKEKNPLEKSVSILFFEPFSRCQGLKIFSLSIYLTFYTLLSEGRVSFARLFPTSLEDACTYQQGYGITETRTNND